jgi:hypothetical protein
MNFSLAAQASSSSGVASTSARASTASVVPSLMRGHRAAPRHRAAARLAPAQATVRQCLSEQKLESSLLALSSIQASAVNRYAQDTKSCIIAIGLTS